MLNMQVRHAKTPCPGWEVATFRKAAKGERRGDSLTDKQNSLTTIGTWRLGTAAFSETSDQDCILSLLLRPAIWTDQLWMTALMIGTPHQQMEWRLYSPTRSEMSQLSSTRFVYLSLTLTFTYGKDCISSILYKKLTLAHLAYNRIGSFKELPFIFLEKTASSLTASNSMICRVSFLQPSTLEDYFRFSWWCSVR